MEGTVNSYVYVVKVKLLHVSNKAMSSCFLNFPHVTTVIESYIQFEEFSNILFVGFF